ncbi:MAG: peptidoglycan-binding protein [Paludibacteraceae bacterium]|nr:peptidoglycan-binding protein [Paludibacteraceae bacterium]
MATRQQFCDAMIEVYDNHGVYIGTGNGERTEELKIGDIRKMEVNYGYDKDKTNTNIRRDLAYIGKCYEKGWNMESSRAGDCSGIPVYCLRKLGVISEKADYNCRTFMAASKTVKLDELQPGDLVFNKKSEPSHMGVYVGNGYVVESKGRDDGVVKRKVSEGSWVVGGRLDWFEDDIPILTRNLYYREGDLMKGEDVRQCQERLNLKGFNCGSADSAFGKKTRDAVIAFQRANGLDPDGVVGQLTWGKLWE